MSSPNPLTDRAKLGESPLWDSEHARLMWVDIASNAVHEFDSVTGRDRSARFDVPVGAVAHRAEGGFLFAAGMGFAVCEWPCVELTWLATVDRGQRMNDAACDPAGRFLAGTLAPDDSAALYRLDRGKASLLLEDVSISNGLDWSPDGHTMYYVDTPLERVDAFDYDVSTGAISARRTLVDLRDIPGRPDGLTVDAEGGIWVAMARGGAAVRRFTPNGRLDHLVEMPVPNVTSLAFGGSDLDDLYITTSQFGAGSGDLPHEGALFRLSDIGIHGREPNRYTS